MFNPNADPEDIAARASELSLEQLSRLRSYTSRIPALKSAADFYKENFEITVSYTIAGLMREYAVLKGHVTQEQAHIQ